jgi:hypothetical protein
VMPDDEPPMKVIAQLWSEATLEERKAWHLFTCQNSRDTAVMQLVQAFTARVDVALAKLAN